MTLKIDSISVRYLFYQPMDEKIKTWTLRFPAKENPNMEKALFDWPIVLQYDVKVRYRLVSRKFFGHEVFQQSVRLTNQNPRAFVSVRQTNQIALFPFVCSLFLFCSRVFLSRSYKNRSNTFFFSWGQFLERPVRFSLQKTNFKIKPFEE